MSSKVFFAAITLAFFGLIPLFAHADLSSEIADRQRRIEELQRQIEEYQAQAEAAGQQSKTLQSEIARLNAQIGQFNAQINQLSASIDQTGFQIEETTTAIDDAEEKIQLHRKALSQYIQRTDQNDRRSLAFILLQNSTLSEFFDYVHNLQRTQDNLRTAIQSITQLQGELDQHRDDLEGKQDDLERLRYLQEIQKGELAGTKGSKDQLLKTTKGEESKYQQLVQQGQADLARIQEEITYLLQGGLTVEDAVSYAKLAAIGAGIRPAFLLALLEVESRLGANVGTGNWKDDMYLCYQRLANYYPSKKQYYLNRAEVEKAAFLQITGLLGLDPDAQKVSREPTYGCGGAMGPAQFIPSTWLSYVDRVKQITGRSIANPWNFQDAFTAAAIKLANAGASSKTSAGEIAAAKAYISGSSSCTKAICNSYANTILQKAAQIEQNL